MKKKIAYCNLILESYSGIANKLESQASAAKASGVPIDFYWLCSSKGPDPTLYNHLNIVQLPGAHWSVTRKNQCRYIGKLLERYHLVILRYPFYDPAFALFYKHKDKTILEHHTKEVPEIDLIKGRARGWIESFFGSSWLRDVRGMISVTPEILDYEVARSGFSGPTAVFPNTIRVSEFTRTSSRGGRTTDDYTQAIMVASHFFPWQGLEAILTEIKESKIKLHLVGLLTDEQHQLAKGVDNIVIHGELPKSEILRLYDKIDVGIGSFNLKEKNMKQAVTLKVREYLAAGVPVVIGHDDPAFPDEFPFVKRLDENAFSHKQVEKFAYNLKNTTRTEIQEASAPYIDSELQLTKLYDFCCSV